MSGNFLETQKCICVYFKIGNKLYAIKAENILEIIQFPMLDYPQKLPNNIVGLLKYDNRVINVVDIRFYTNASVESYSIQNKVIITKIDGMIFGIISDEIEGIISLDTNLINKLPNCTENSLINSLYKYNDSSVFILNLSSLKDILTEDRNIYDEIDVKSLIPADESSKEILTRRANELITKSAYNFETTLLQQNNQYISVNLNDNFYGISLDYLKEVVKNVSVTKVPATPDFIDGIMNLRGEYITVINLKKFLNLPDNKVLEEKPAVVINAKDLTIALIVDKINELFEFSEHTECKSPDCYYAGEFIRNNVPYTVLNIDNIVSDRRIAVTDIE